MKLAVSAEARANLREIGDYLAERNPRRAITLLDEIEERFRRIALSPQAYSFVPRHESSGIRRAVHGSYLIFFQIEAGRVNILRVLHGSRDYERILFPDDV